MTAENNKWYSWYRAFDEHHSPEERRQWYSGAARAYRWARPTYPNSLIERVVAQLNDKETLLEIGCGPGIATTAFAEKGFRIDGVEPSPAACKLAQKSCEVYRNSVTIHNSTFEDYSLGNQRFDAVLAATSFHWISPKVACKKSAAALNPGGSLILLWATPPQPSDEIYQYLQPVYERHGLAEMGHEQHRTQAYYQGNFENFAKMVGDSGYFEATPVEVDTHHSIYSIEKYLALLSTLSGYIALEAEQRENLLSELGEHLAKKLETGAFETIHWFASQVTPLVTKP